MAEGTESAAAFLEAFAALGQTRDGKRAISSDDIVDLVRRHPEESAAAARAFAELGVADRALAQRAVSLAAAYEIAFGDDSVALVVDAALARGGMTDPGIDVEPAPNAPGEPAALHDLVISTTMMLNRDTYELVDMFSHSRARGQEAIDRMRSLRGRCRLFFTVSKNEPREVWELGEVRAFVNEVNQRMPYFPYYLSHDPAEGMVHLWLACLAPEHAVDGAVVDYADEAVAVQAAFMIRVVGMLAQLLGDEPEQVIDDVLAHLPADYVDFVKTLEASTRDADE